MVKLQERLADWQEHWANYDCISTRHEFQEKFYSKYEPQKSFELAHRKNKRFLKVPLDSIKKSNLLEIIQKLSHRIVVGKYDVHALSLRDGRTLTSLPVKFPVDNNGSLVGVRLLKQPFLKTEVPPFLN